MMTDKQDRDYLKDVPKDIQDLIYEGRESEVVKLLVKQKGLGKLEAAMQTSQIVHRMKKELQGASSLSLPKSKPTFTAKQEQIIGWLIVSLALFIGLALTIIGIFGLGTGMASNSWPSTEGNITQSRTERKRSGTGQNKTTSTKLIINYTFSIEGKTYTGDRVASSPAMFGKKFIARRYPKGKTVKVYYDEKDPANCLLEPGIQGKNFILPGIGLVILAVGGILLRVQLSVTRERSELKDGNEGDI